MILIELLVTHIVGRVISKSFLRKKDAIRMALRIWIYTLLISFLLKRISETIFVMGAASELNITEAPMIQFGNDDSSRFEFEGDLKAEESLESRGDPKSKLHLNLSSVAEKVKAENEIPETKSLKINKKYLDCYNLKTPSATKEKAEELKNLCINEHEWDEITETYFDPEPDSSRRKLHGIVMNTLEERPVNKSTYEHGDCLYKTKFQMRPYPGDCYGKVRKFENKQLINFWGEIYGDFYYTFDFVLYNQMLPHRKENQFWYLILYLKTLVLLIPNPATIKRLMTLKELLETDLDNIDRTFTQILGSGVVDE